MSTFDQRVSASGNDVEEQPSDGAIIGDGNTLDMGRETIGLRFTGVNVPQGQTLDSAYLEFVADGTDTAAPDIEFYCEAADDASAFGTGTNDLTNRTTTTAFYAYPDVDWSINNTYQTGDLSGPLEEVFSRPGWSSGNAINFIVYGNSPSARRRAKSWDRDSAQAPRLVMTWTESVTHNLTATVAGFSSTSTPALAIAHKLAASVAANSDASSPALAIAHALAGATAGASFTSTPTLAIAHAFAASVAAVSSLADVEVLISHLHALAATVAATSNTSTPALAIAHKLAAEVAANSDASMPALAIAHALAAEVAGLSSVSDVDLLLTTLHRLSASIAGSSSTSTPALGIAHTLAASVGAQTDTNTPRLSIAHYLAAHVSGSTVTSAPNLVLKQIAGIMLVHISGRRPKVSFTARAPEGGFVACRPGVTFTVRD